MNETKDIKKIVKQLLKRDKGAVDTEIIHPAREWATGLVVALALVVSGSGLCFYLFVYYGKEIKKEVVLTESVVVYQASAISEALELFASKQKKFTEILEMENTDLVIKSDREANNFDGPLSDELIISPTESTVDSPQIDSDSEIVQPRLSL